MKKLIIPALLLFVVALAYLTVKDQIKRNNQTRSYELTYYNGDTEIVTLHGSLKLMRGCAIAYYSTETRCGVRKFKPLKP